MPSSGFPLRPSVQPIHRGGVRWKHGGGHTTQTWHSSSPNDYNMLNLLSSPSSCKFSKRRLTYIFCSMLWIQKKSSLSLKCEVRIATPFSHAACFKRQTLHSSLEGLRAIDQNYKNENLYSLEIQIAVSLQWVSLVPSLKRYLHHYWNNTLHE